MLLPLARQGRHDRGHRLSQLREITVIRHDDICDVSTGLIIGLRCYSGCRVARVHTPSLLKAFDTNQLRRFDNHDGVIAMA